MWKNYLIIAWRNLMKYKIISSINLSGLTVGLTCCLLITTYILGELSYDRYNTQADNIYRLTRTFYSVDGSVSLSLSTVAPPFGLYLPSDFPEIRRMTRLLPNGTTPLQYQDKLFNETSVYFADTNLVHVFTVNVLEGDPNRSLSEPYTAMITDELARKYFGNEDPIGKVVKVDTRFNYRITGVYQSFPTNAHLHPDMLLSFITLKDTAVYGEEDLRTDWGNNSFFTYILVPKGFNPQRMIARFPAFLNRHMDRESYIGGLPSRYTSLGLQKLTDIHLYSHTDYEAEPNGDITRVYVFSLIACVILLIGCINYTNLSTARSVLRAREVGIRKVVGASRRELILQFLTESVAVSAMATALAFALTYLLVPWVNRVSGLSLSFSTLLRPLVLIPLIATPLFLGILAGSYPAVFLSSFQPIKTLKGFFKAANSGLPFRKVLVVTQFAIGIVLIITTVVVFQQLYYVQHAPQGYQRNHMVTLPYYRDAMDQRYEAFRADLLRNPQVESVSRSSRVPTGRLLDDNSAFTLSGDSMVPVNTDIKYVSVDYDFVPTYGIRLLAGRNYSREYGTDTLSFVINAAAARVLRWTPQEAIGKPFKYGSVSGHVIGVVDDFHFESMHESVAPLVLMMPALDRGDQFNNMTVRLSGRDVSGTLADMKKIWESYLPDHPWQYTFLDDRYAKLYKAEQVQESLFSVFAGIAIFIACLGLFGLSAFAIAQRVKEIGVRKVLGASTGSLVALLSGDFLKLVGFSSVLAVPVAWYAMEKWLHGFAYHIGIAWWVFLLGAVAAAAIALATVSIQATRAARANPVKSLRTE